MLVDLHWVNHQPNPNITKFDTKDGSLSVTFQDGDKSWDTTLAERVHKGVYFSFALGIHVDFYTEYNVVNCIEDWQSWIAEIAKTTDEAEKQKIRNKFIHMPMEFGRADNLKQIFKRCRQYVNDPEPYVLQLHWYDNTNEKNYKNGTYIGKNKNADKVLAFHWHRLVRKD